MATESIEIALGGRTWTVEQLPFGALKRMQPRYLAFVASVEGADGLTMIAAPEYLEDMGEIVRSVLGEAGHAIDKPAFESLRFDMADLLREFRKIGPYLGLATAKGEA